MWHSAIAAVFVLDFFQQYRELLQGHVGIEADCHV
jgi:hypothetical protein